MAQGHIFLLKYGISFLNNYKGEEELPIVVSKSFNTELI
jgi:hypothetical protein